MTLVTDQNGDVSAGIAVNVTAPTQIATIRATDVTSGNQVTGNFLIQQVTDGSQILSVIPTGTVTIDGPDATTCSTGVVVQYYIFGGTPPYTVSETFPGAVTLSSNPGHDQWRQLHRDDHRRLLRQHAIRDHRCHGAHDPGRQFAVADQ